MIGPARHPWQRDVLVSAGSKTPVQIRPSLTSRYPLSACERAVPGQHSDNARMNYGNPGAITVQSHTNATRGGNIGHTIRGHGGDMGRSIAIVEDEPLIRENYADVLTKHSFEVTSYAGRAEAIAAFRDKLPNLLIIDVGLGDEIEGGFDLCREVRAISPTVPIIFLTARDSDLDAISGLRLGADDYLTKDISLPHLVARITALFRRMDAVNQPAVAEKLLKRGSLEIDPDRLTLKWKGQNLDLTITEFWLVHNLARHPGHVKNRDQLMQEANIVVDDQTITSHIKRIRKKFMAIDPAFEAIETVYGAGYRWKTDN